MFLDRGADTVVTSIEERIARWTLLPAGNGEGLQVLNYKPGQEYKVRLRVGGRVGGGRRWCMRPGQQHSTAHQTQISQQHSRLPSCHSSTHFLQAHWDYFFGKWGERGGGEEGDDPDRLVPLGGVMSAPHRHIATVASHMLLLSSLPLPRCADKKNGESNGGNRYATVLM